MAKKKSPPAIITINRDCSEVEDENPMGPHIAMFLKGSLGFTLAMVVVTTICIWSVDFRKTSVFSTMTGKNETVTETTAP